MKYDSDDVRFFTINHHETKKMRKKKSIESIVKEDRTNSPSRFWNSRWTAPSRCGSSDLLAVGPISVELRSVLHELRMARIFVHSSFSSKGLSTDKLVRLGRFPPFDLAKHSIHREQCKQIDRTRIKSHSPVGAILVVTLDRRRWSRAASWQRIWPIHWWLVTGHWSS